MAILVTGGAGYIGSHTVVELQNAGYDVVVLDNLSNASEKSLERVSKITGKPVKFYKADILDRDALNEIFDKEDIDSCIHFAGLKAVGESVAKPWEYYENNIAGTLTLVDVMRKHNVKNIIFSSSATVYGDPAIIPITEECNGLTGEMLSFSDKALEKIIHNYTREAGVRNLERRIGEICRKAAREFLEKKRKSVHITEGNLQKYLGKEKITFENANEEDEVGIVRGLAWTSVGGDTLQIEVNVMPGDGKLQMTGQMGDVMKESAQIALTYVKSVADRYGVESKYFKEHDLHLHIPEGAVPKDGPSAGITMATAMLSAVTGKKVLASVAMTGEITLRGHVLPIGGLKEKTLAARMAHMKKVLVPDKNRPDMAEISKEITKGMEIVFVKTMDDVVREAFA